MSSKITGKTTNDLLANFFVTLTANLQRLSASESLVVQGILKELEMDIVTKLRDNPNMSQWRKARYDALLSQTRETIKTGYTKIADHHQDFLTSTAEVSSKGAAAIFSSVGVPLQSVVLTHEQLVAIAKNTLIEGSPSRAWWAKQSSSLQDAFTRQMKMGYASGETIDQLVQRVRGTATGKKNSYIINGKKKMYVEFSGGIMDTGTRQAEALVRTSTQQIAADARMEMFRKNADILKGVMWLSTLDSRTTPLCRAHDGLLYDLEGQPIGHEVPFLGGPPAHWNCFPADSNLQAVGKLEAVYRRNYEGELVIFETASGPKKAVTPNHPILTLRGWVRANSLVVGDKVVKRGLSDGKIGLVCANNVENEVAKAHEFTEPRRFMGTVVHLEVPCSPQDFHNEAVNKEIADVWADYDLLLERVSGTTEHIGKDQFLFSNTHGPVFDSGSQSCFYPANTWSLAPHCRVGFGDKLLAFFGRGSGHSGALLLPSISGFDTELSEAETDAVRRTMKHLGYACNANTRVKKLHSFVDVNIISVVNSLPMDTVCLKDTADGAFPDTIFFAYFPDGTILPVHFDDVVNVSRKEFSGHVYNLQCSSGAIVLEDTITHNCRSTLVPVTKSFEELGGTPGVTQEYLEQIGEGTRASMNGEVPDALTFDAWFRGLPEADQIAFLGPKKYAIWKEAGLNFADMIDQRGNPLTIQQLAAAYGVKIEESALSGIPNVPKEMVSAIAVEQQAQALASQMAREAAEAAAAVEAEKAAQEVANAQAEIAKIASSKNAFVKPVWDEYGEQLDGTPQENLAFLNAKIKHEKSAQTSWKKLQKTVEEGTVDANSQDYIKYMKQKTAMEQVKDIPMPSQKMAAYKNALKQLHEQNRLYISKLADAAANPFLEDLEFRWSAEMGKQGKQLPYWNMQQYHDELMSYIQMQDKVATKKLIGDKGTPLDFAIQTQALDEAIKAVPQDLPGSNVATLKEYEALKKKLKLAEKAASKELENLLLDANYDAAHAAALADNPSLLLPSDILQATKAKYQDFVADAQEHLLAASTATGAVEKKAWSTLEAQFTGTSPLEKWAEYQVVLAKTQQELANAGIEAIQEAIGTHQLDGSILTVGSKQFDVVDPQGLAEWKKYKSMHLSKYKQAVLVGKAVAPSHQLVYDGLSAAEKEAFDDSLAKALAKKGAMPPTSNAVPEPGTLQLSQMEKIGSQKGSNEGGFFRDRRTGTEYYIKFPASEDIARNELLAAKLYEAAGVEVPELTLLNDGSRVGIASKIKAGLSSGTAAELAKAIGAANNYAVDAWLANWDVVGLNYDNLLLTEAGTAFRVDVGGSLRYRAQGGLKGNAFGKVVEELESLRDARVNRQSASVFGKIKKVDLEAGVRKVLDLSDAQIRELVAQYGPVDAETANELADTLIARKQYLAQKFPHLAAPKSAPPLPDAGLLVGDADMRAIKNGRINGYALPADRDKIEDQNVLFWFEKNTANEDFVGLRFKFTESALDDVLARLQISEEVPLSAGERALQKDFAEFQQKFHLQWNVSHNKAGATIDKALVTKNLKDLEDTYKSLRTKMANQAAELAEQLDALYKKPLKDLHKTLTAGDVFKPLGMVAKGKYQTLPFSQVDFLKMRANAGLNVRKAANEQGRLQWKKVTGTYYQTQIKDGFAVRTKTLLERGGEWKYVYEATTPDGVRVRVWPGEKIAGQAFMNQVEVLAPGNSKAVVNKALKLVEDELGIPVVAPQLADREEMYLRMIARHRGDWEVLDHADALQRRSTPTAEISAYLKDALSSRIGSDVTKLSGYNPDGVYEAFDSSFRRWYLPGIDTDKGWRQFTRDYVVHHEITGGKSLADTLDAVLNSGGRMITTGSKTRYGIPWSGMSPEADMDTGGADYFFTRIFSKKKRLSYQPGLVWNSRVAARLDTVSYPGDKFGRTTDNFVRIYSQHGVEGYKISAQNDRNELNFKNGLSIFDGLDHINCRGVEEAEKVLAVLKKHGWDKTWIDGRPVEDLIWIGGRKYERSAK